MSVGETGEQIYKSFEWRDRPGLTTLLACAAWGGFTIVYLILQIITDLKLYGSPTPKVRQIHSQNEDDITLIIIDE